MRVVAIDGDSARCEAGGVEREASLFLLAHETVACGDFVLVHVGYAIQKIDPAAARAAWTAYEALRESADHA